LKIKELKMALRENNYLVVPATARNKFNLRGNELLVFGIIYGFSQDGLSLFSGSTAYISEWTGLSRRTVLRILKDFTERGIFIKLSCSGKECKYSVNFEFENDNKSNLTSDKMSQVKELTTGDKMAQVPMTKCTRTYDKMSHNNIYNINNNIKENIKRKKFIKPSLQELKNYCIEINSKIDAQRFFDYYEANGWIAGKVSMKDWKAAIRNWTRNDFNSCKSKSTINKHDYQKEITQKELDQYDRK
jgi:hypothetical protein